MKTESPVVTPLEQRFMQVNLISFIDGNAEIFVTPLLLFTVDVQGNAVHCAGNYVRRERSPSNESRSVRR